METKPRLLPHCQLKPPPGGVDAQRWPIPGSFFTLDDVKPQTLWPQALLKGLRQLFTLPSCLQGLLCEDTSPFCSFPLTPSPVSRVPAAVFGIVGCSVSCHIKAVMHLHCQDPMSPSMWSLGSPHPSGVWLYYSALWGEAHTTTEPSWSSGWLVVVNTLLRDRQPHGQGVSYP